MIGSEMAVNGHTRPTAQAAIRMGIRMGRLWSSVLQNVPQLAPLTVVRDLPNPPSFQLRITARRFTSCSSSPWKELRTLRSAAVAHEDVDRFLSKLGHPPAAEDGPRLSCLADGPVARTH